MQKISPNQINVTFRPDTKGWLAVVNNEKEVQGLNTNLTVTITLIFTDGSKKFDPNDLLPLQFEDLHLAMIGGFKHLSEIIGKVEITVGKMASRKMVTVGLHIPTKDGRVICHAITTEKAPLEKYIILEE